MTRGTRYDLTALLLAAGLAAGSAVAAADGCETDPRRRQLDFWIGEWQLVGEPGRQQHGTHSVRKGEKGCVIEERWQAADGGSGRSLGYFDPAAGRWRLDRVDDRGRVARYEGELRDGAMHFLGSRIEPDGSASRARLVLTPGAGPAVRQRIELAAEGAATWSAYFDGSYLPVDRALAAAGVAAPADAAPAPDPLGPEPAVEADPEPFAATPAVRHGSVRPQTGMVTSESLARGRAKIPMASPMVLRFPVGRLDRLQPGYAWTTREVARYELEETTIEAIKLARGRPAGGREPVEVTAQLTTPRRLVRVRLAVALRVGDQRVAEATLPEVRVGIGLPAQLEDGVVEYTLVLELEKGRLAELFGGDQQPELEVTLEELR